MYLAKSRYKSLSCNSLKSLTSVSLVSSKGIGTVSHFWFVPNIIQSLANYSDNFLHVAAYHIAEYNTKSQKIGS